MSSRNSKNGAAGRDHARAAAVDPVMASVETLRSGNVLTEAIARVWREAGEVAPIHRVDILNVHYRPTRGARLVAAATVLEPDGTESLRPQYLFVQVYRSSERAERRAAVASKHDLSCVGPAMFLLPGHAAVVWALPNGPRLRPAKIGFNPSKLRRHLRKLARKLERPPEIVPRYPRAQLIRYVPRRRTVFRIDHIEGLFDRAAFLKVYEPRMFVRARRNLRRIQRVADRLAFAAPRLLLSSQRRRALLMEELPGQHFTDAVASDPASFAPVGRALASLHGSNVKTRRGRWKSKKERRGFAAAVADLKLAAPEFAERLTAVAKGLKRRRVKPPIDERVPIHGNLFGDQILLDGDRVGIVDWDDLCLGDGMYDLGRLLAHMRYVAIVEPDRSDELLSGFLRLLDVYVEERGAPIAWARLEWNALVALMVRVKISSLRPLAPGWRDHLGGAVQIVEEALGDGFDWIERARERPPSTERPPRSQPALESR